MTSLVLFQLIVNILLFAFIGLLWSRLRHLTGDEGRLKQGLQILTTKIAILEDLGQKVDEQSQQTLKILDLKKEAIESLLEKAIATMHQIDEKTSQVTVNSEALVERDNAIKFTKAALLANKGVSAAEIAQQVGLGIQESELIYSLNSQHLQFKLEDLPGWMLPHIQETIS